MVDALSHPRMNAPRKRIHFFKRGSPFILCQLANKEKPESAYLSLASQSQPILYTLLLRLNRREFM
jgi:hypothetical protein